MRFAHLLHRGRRELAARCRDTYVLLSTLGAEWPTEIGALLRSGVDLQALQAAADVAQAARSIAVRDVSYAPMLADGARIFCLGLNFVDHAREAKLDRPDHPVVFARFPSSFVGHEQPLVRPLLSHHFDFEAELAVMIGRGGRHIPREAALTHVAGYTLLHDGTIRDYQRHTSQWLLGKNFERSGSVGPELVTADELPRGAAGLMLRGILNGTVMQQASTDGMIFDVATSIAYISEAIALQPGDLISLGTPAGVGAARSPQVFLQPGDTFEVELERIGSLRNPVKAEKDPFELS